MGGFGAIVPRTWESAAAAAVVLSAVIGGTIGVYHWTQGTPVPFREHVDRICLDSAAGYGEVSGRSASAERQRADIASMELRRLEALDPPTEAALGFSAFVAVEARIARLRDSIAGAVGAGRPTSSLRNQLSFAQDQLYSMSRELGLNVCGQYRTDFG